MRKLTTMVIVGIMVSTGLLGLLIFMPDEEIKVSAATINVPADYPTIQQAINAASPGDTILVAAGTYYENVVINKTISLIGESSETTIIDVVNEKYN